MSVARGNLLYIYEKCLLDGIGSFVSARRKFLYISGSTIIRYKGKFSKIDINLLVLHSGLCTNKTYNN